MLSVGWLVGWIVLPTIVLLGVLGLCSPEICRWEGWSPFHAVSVAVGWGAIGALIGWLKGKKKQKNMSTSL